MNQQWGESAGASAFAGMDAGATELVAEPLLDAICILEREDVAVALEAMATPVCHWRLSATPPRLFPPGRGPIPLSRQDYAVLLTLASGGECVRREAIVDAMGGDLEHDPRRLDTQMRRLRRKVEEACGLKLPISTVRAVGYRVYQRIEVFG
jgi:DNA-binding response OmpR family regulator